MSATDAQSRDSALPLESVIITAELTRRRSRPPDYEAENRALVSLMHETASPSGNVLQKLVETVLSLCRAHSAGISILEMQNRRKVFRWHATAGRWSSFLGSTMPREISPCGTVLDRNSVLLLSHPERHFPFPPEIAPPIVEVLLTPFHVAGEPVGTIWVIAHDEKRKFDREDERLIASLGKFASIAYQVLTGQHVMEHQIAERKQAEEALRQSHANLEQMVEQRNAALQELSSSLLRSQDEERRRIARELHDSLGQYLASAKMSLEALEKRPGATEKETQSFEYLMNTLDRCLTETRTISYLLHPPLLDDVGFSSTAKWYAEGFSERSGIQVNLNIPEELKRLPGGLELALFRILQESLTNIHRYSHSQSVDIKLELGAGEIALEVRDYGQGIPPEVLERFRVQGGTGAGVGLRSMRDRISELGGRFEIQSDKNGTLIRVTAPSSDAAKKPEVAGGKPTGA